MPSFVSGQVVSFSLDEFDILTIDGQALLQVTPSGHHTYETQASGHQVVGPFGVITAVVLNGKGAGTYVAGPSNQPLPVVMVDISAAQQAAPTAAQLAATGTLYQLNAAPYTIYQSTGTSLAAIGGGSGSSTFAGLSDAASANLPVTNTPLASALANLATSNNPTFTGTVTGVTKTHVGLGSVDNTSDANKPVSIAQAAALALKQDALVAGSNITIVGTTISSSGSGGSSTFAGLSDAASAPIASTNSSVATALSTKAPTAGPTFTGTVAGITAAMVGLGNVNNTSDATVIAAAQAASVGNDLISSTTIAPSKSAVNSGLALKANADSPAFTGTPTGLTKTHVGLANVDNTSDASKPVSTAQQTALDLKAPGGNLIAYAGTGRSLTSADNGNIIRTSNGSAVSITVPSGLPAGFSCLIVQGGAGLVTAVQGSGTTLTGSPALVTSGLDSDLTIVPAGSNVYTVYSPVSGGGSSTLAGLSDIATYNLATNNTSVAAIKTTADAAQPAATDAEAAQDAVAAAFAAGTHTNVTVTYNDAANSISLISTGGGSTLAVISGTRGTGNTLTATMSTGWAGTFQWQSLISAVWTNLAGATSSTYVLQSADAPRDVRCIVTPTTYTSNVLAGVTANLFDELWPGSAGAAPPVGWTANSGNITQTGSATATWQGGATPTGYCIRNVSTTTYVLTAVVTPRGDFPAIVFQSDSSNTNFNNIVFHASTGKLRYFEHNGGSDFNIIDGSTVLDQTSLGPVYTIEVTVSSSTVAVRLKTGAGSFIAETGMTAMSVAHNGSLTYVGFAQGVTSAGSMFGEIKAV